MPIRPDLRRHYGREWDDLARRLKDEAGWNCQGSPAYPDCRAAHGSPHPVTGSIVVLSVAHLDHNPENNARANLRVWCQRCHNTYDVRHRARNAFLTRAKKRGQLVMFPQKKYWRK